MAELYSVDLEHQFIGELLVNPEKLSDVAAHVKPESFYVRQAGVAFEAMLTMLDKSLPIDPLTVAEECEKQSSSGEWSQYLCKLAAHCLMTGNLEAHAARISEHATVRRLLSIMQDACKTCYDTTLEPHEKIARAQQAVLDLVSMKSKRGPKTSKEVLRSWYAHLETRLNAENGLAGISTGFPALDEVIGGLRGGQLIVIAARPKQGKTIMALNIGASVIKQDKSVVVFSLEMPEEQLMDRVASNMTNTFYRNIQTVDFDDAQWSNVASFMAWMAEKPFLIDDDSDVTVSDIRARARAIAAKQPLGLIIVDYLQLVHATGENENIRIGSVATGLKKMAKELDCPVIALAQMNRGVEDRQDKKPILRDLRGSGQIEQDADAVLFLHEVAEGKTELIIGACRHAEKGSVWLDQRFEFMRFAPGLPHTPAQEELRPFKKKRPGMYDG